MRELINKMHSHTANLLEHVDVDCSRLYGEGLGLRPLTSASAAPDWARHVLARTFLRLGQWSEAIQGPHWLNVGYSFWHMS